MLGLTVSYAGETEKENKGRTSAVIVQYTQKIFKKDLKSNGNLCIITIKATRQSAFGKGEMGVTKF